MPSIKIYMEKKGPLANAYFKRYYKKHKHLCIEKTDIRAVFKEEGTKEEIDKAVKQIQGTIPLFSYFGLFFAFEVIDDKK